MRLFVRKFLLTTLISMLNLMGSITREQYAMLILHMSQQRLHVLKFNLATVEVLAYALPKNAFTVHFVEVKTNFYLVLFLLLHLKFN